MKNFQQQKLALGSQAIYTLVAKDENHVAKTFDKLWELTAEFENRFSRFKLDSELTNFNSQAGTKVLISAEYIGLLKTCRDMSLKTDGLFNPFILPALNKAGYIGSWPNTEVFSEKLNYGARINVVPITELQIEANSAKIPASTALDFGGIGKGYLLDELGKYLATQQLDNYWLSLGGDILCSGHNSNQEQWSVAIQNANTKTESIGSISNNSDKRLAIATSGITKRRGKNNGKNWHHIIDPRNGIPAVTDILTATVTAQSATEADVLAKCAVILGSTKATLLADKYNLGEIYLQLSNGQTKLTKIKHGVPK